MIGVPFNDYQCLGSVTEVVAELVRNQDPTIMELARKHETIPNLIAWIRSLPQKDDDGDKSDGPRISACKPMQRLRIPAENPNCFERSALFCAVAEFIDPHPVRQLATLDTEVGMHTFPLENGAPVILDPTVPRNCVELALDQHTRNCAGPTPVDARDCIEWVAQLAEAGAANFRNGPSRVRLARNAMMRIVDGGAAPADGVEIDLIGWMLALAERMARRYGRRAIEIVRTTAQVVADLADEALARPHRNLSLEIGGKKLRPSPWLTSFAKATGRIGVDIGAVAVRTKLASLGVGDDMVDVVEEELNREGLTLGRVARPKRLPTIANVINKRAA